MLPLHHIKKILLCMSACMTACMSACLLMAACNDQYGQPTTPETDADEAFLDDSDTDTISYITVIDIIE